MGIREIFLTIEKELINVEKKWWDERKLPSSNNFNNLLGQESSMDPKISGWKFEE